MEMLKDMDRSQLLKTVKDLIDKMKDMRSSQANYFQLQRENEHFKLNEINYKIILQENSKLKKELRTRQDASKLIKENKEDFLKREEQLNKIIKEKDKLNKQLKQECDPLRKTIRDLEAALRKQEKENGVKMHSLEIVLEESDNKLGKLREKNASLQGANTVFQDDIKKLQKQMNQLQHDVKELQFENNSLDKKLNETCGQELYHKKMVRTLERKCCDLEKQLGSKNNYDHRQEAPRDERKPADRELQSKLTAKYMELEKMDLVLKQKDTEIEQLKKEKSRLVSLSDKIELIPRYKRVIRERGDTIKSLTAQLQMYISKNDEYKSEKATLLDREAAIKKSYLELKMQNSELCAKKADGIPLPQSSLVSLKQSRGHQLDTRRTTVKPIGVRLPPISNQHQPKPGFKLGHNLSYTTLHKALPKLDTTQNIHKSGGIHA